MGEPFMKSYPSFIPSVMRILPFLTESKLRILGLFMGCEVVRSALIVGSY